MSGQCIASILLDDGGNVSRSAEAEHERAVAMTDLLHDNLFAPVGLENGPYDVRLGVEDGRLAFGIRSAEKKEQRVVLPVGSLKPIIRDYFLICESYYDAIKKGGHGKLEAIDAGRRSVHNEGAELLKLLLANKIAVDFPTARRLFTLVCVLHIK